MIFCYDKTKSTRTSCFSRAGKSTVYSCFILYILFRYEVDCVLPRILNNPHQNKIASITDRLLYVRCPRRMCGAVIRSGDELVCPGLLQQATRRERFHRRAAVDGLREAGKTGNGTTCHYPYYHSSTTAIARNNEPFFIEMGQ